MRGLSGSRRGIALYLLTWLFLGCALAGVIAVAGAAAPLNALLFALPLNLVYAFAAGFSAYYLCRAYPLGSARPVLIPLVFTVAATVAGFLWLALAQAWNAVCLLLEVSWAGVVLTPQLSALIVGVGLLLYGLAAAVNYLVIAFLQVQGAEQRALEARLAAQEAELRMLRTQIDPHFLFNSLNSISALTSQDPKGARQMALQLAAFFRQSLGMEAHRMVTLEQELLLIRHFLAIEQVRFGDRLRIREAVGEDALACLLPPMLIQPLVENAVKHGICQLAEGGVVSLMVRRDGSQLRIVVENPADPARAAGNLKGIGLANVRQRLAGAYQHEASIHWTRQPDRFTVEITMPAQVEVPPG
ncbi:histidine kinase [Oxalobacteraceae bacterium]|nr:histidine kinase [Oxalobacteraceae bacterium]